MSMWMKQQVVNEFDNSRAWKIICLYNLPLYILALKFQMSAICHVVLEAFN